MMIINGYNSNIFRQYDIRGVFNKDLTPEIAQVIGIAYGIYLLKETRGKKQEAKLKVSVCRDVRLSSTVLRDSLIQGILSTGIDVVDIGECPTPLQYFSLFHLSLDGGIMITGSHNPPEFNGFKISVGKETIYGESIQEIRRIVEGRRHEAGGKRQDKDGKLEYYDIISAYVDYIKRQFNGLSDGPPIKVVVDAGNGIGGVVAPKLLRELGYDVIELFCKPDGNFPNHHPDPTIPDNLKDLISMVKEQNADMGIAYDGDADRIGVVDENGRIIWGDQLMIIFARDILKNSASRIPHPTSERPAFVGEVKCSQVMYDEIKKLGGNAVMWKTGHSFIKSKMKEIGAVFAGEMSGHMFFADRYFGYDDAIYSTCRLIEIFSRQRLKNKMFRFSDLLSDLPKAYSTPEIRIDCPDEDKFKIVDKFSETIGVDNENIKIKDIIKIDGLRIIFDNGWALIRASNTQPILVLRFEASSEKWLKGIRKLVEGKLATTLTAERG